MERRALGKRAVGLVALCCLSVALLVWFGSLGPAPGAGAFPTGDTLTTDYSAYVGSEVVVTGPAVERDPLVVATGPERSLELRVVGYDGQPERGTRLRLHGTALGGKRLQVSSGFAVPDRGLWYTWGISFLAGLWVLTRLLREWTIDQDTLSIVPRTAIDGQDGDDGA